MNRNNLTRFLSKNKCFILREGAKHSVFFNPLTRRSTTVPRHNEIDNFLAKKICRDLGLRELKR
jgi:hypothetical protein